MSISSVSTCLIHHYLRYVRQVARELLKLRLHTRGVNARHSMLTHKPLHL